MKYTILAGMSFALIVSPAFAYAQEAHDVAGAAKCSTWLEWGQKAKMDDKYKTLRFVGANWMQGYVTGVSYAFEAAKKIRLHFSQTERDSDALSSWLDEFCQAHPDMNFDSAGQWLVDDISSSSSAAAIEAIVQDGIYKADQAKTAVSEAYLLNGGMDAVRSLVARWTFKPTDYVSNISVSPTSGAITITYSARVPEISGTTIILTPQATVGNSFKLLNAISADQIDSVAWACSSSTNLFTLKHGMSVGATGTLKATYAPSNCR